MSIRKRFNKTFGSEDDVEVERRRFVERVNQLIFHDIDTVKRRAFKYEQKFDILCFELGVNANDIPMRMIGESIHEEFITPSIRTLTRDDFAQTLLVLCILYVYLDKEHSYEKDITQQWLSKTIKLILSRCSCDIGIRWKEGFFYPVGAEELDKSLIDETLTWLNNYPDERKDYRRALECYLGAESLTDVVKKCYLAIEGVTRKVLGNDKTLDNNKEQLLQKIDLSDGWKSILATYIKYAHDYRHASEQRHEITKQEAEGYLYMTGLIIRLIIESK